ncbi:MAG: glycosyltransferase family 87 protein [Candidatus Binataceae bacterium]
MHREKRATANPDPATTRAHPLLRGRIAYWLKNPYVAGFLCLAAIVPILITLNDMRTRFSVDGFLCGANDFPCYYVWAWAIRDGVNAYTTDLRETAFTLGLAMHHLHRADYPPTFILMMEPFTPLPFTTAYWVWTAVNFVALLLSLYLLLVKGLKLDANTSLSLAALAFFYEPIAASFGWGQPNMIILLLIVAAWLCLGQGKDLAGGLILAFAGLLKIYPLILIGYLVAKRRWRALFFTACGLVVGAAVTAAAIGVSNSLSFASRLPAITNGSFLASANQLASPSLINNDAFLSRLFWQLSRTAWNSPVDWIRRLLVMLSNLALLALTMSATLFSPRDRDHDQAAFALWLVASALLAPTAWVHYMTMFLILFAILAAAALRGRAPSSAIWLGAASFILVILSVPRDFIIALPPRFSLTEYSVPFFSILATILPRPVLILVENNWLFALTILAYASAYQLTTNSPPPQTARRAIRFQA